MAVFTFSNFQVVIGQWLPLKHMKAICTERDITMESTHISLLTSRESPLVVIIKAEALDLHITCSNKRYPDLLRALCRGDARSCDLAALRKHYDRHGRREGRRFGCWNVTQARDVVRPKTTVANDSFLSVAGWWQKGR